MRKYKVLSSADKTCFEVALNSYIKDGWLPEPGTFQVHSVKAPEFAKVLYYQHYTILVSAEIDKSHA